MAVIGERLAQPEAGWRRFDDSDGLIYYGGTWQTNMNNASSWMGTRHISSNLPDKVVKIVFKGTKFRLLVNSASNRSTQSTISIDGETETFSSRFTTTLTIAPTRLAYEKTGLPYGYHTVIINDNTTDYLDIDAIDVDDDGEIVRYDYDINSDSTDPIEKYGVAWFTFDESSGNVLDKLGGNYVGTLTNSPQRVEGWDGKGKALNMNGSSQYVTFNSPVIPVGEKTIRFKLKINQIKTLARVFCTATASTNGGISINVASGYIFIEVRHPNGTVSNRLPLLEVDKWYDLVVIYEGSGANTVLIAYLNGELVLRRRLNITPQLPVNLRLGNLAGNPIASDSFNGQIDEIQIFAKALTPSDISSNKIVVRTSNNQIVTLPNREGKVRHILSGDSIDIVNQGYEWQEIDDSVESQGFNFIQNTTEYELVSKQNTSTINGKKFTIPISQTFKTIKVEDNY